MAAINDLLRQVPDQVLRARLEEEIEHISKNKKFGLVFEEHIPECTPLYGIGVKPGISVARKIGQINEVLTVVSMDGDEARCYSKVTGETEVINISELVPVAQFGEPIFPMLQPIDAIQNDPGNSLWHSLIEAKDWKYNNDYVDGSDAYRHSKWLSFMEKRLKIAKRLLNPEESVLLVAIDEKEYLHLGCLLEEMFPEGEMQMVTTVINAKGAVRDGKFSRVEEYIFVITMGNAHVHSLQYNMLDTTSDDVTEEPKPVDWLGFRRREATSMRSARPNQFYPVFVDNESGKIVRIGERIDFEVPRETVQAPEGCTALWPLKPDGTEMLWGLTPDVARANL